MSGIGRLIHEEVLEEWKTLDKWDGFSRFSREEQLKLEAEVSSRVDKLLCLNQIGDTKKEFRVRSAFHAAPGPLLTFSWGQTVTVTDERDGWSYGFVQQTGVYGWFPSALTYATREPALYPVAEHERAGGIKSRSPSPQRGRRGAGAGGLPTWAGAKVKQEVIEDDPALLDIDAFRHCIDEKLSDGEIRKNARKFLDLVTKGPLGGAMYISAQLAVLPSQLFKFQWVENVTSMSLVGNPKLSTLPPTMVVFTALQEVLLDKGFHTLPAVLELISALRKVTVHKDCQIPDRKRHFRVEFLFLTHFLERKGN